MQRSNIAFITLILFALSMAFWLNENDINQDAFLVAQNGVVRIPTIQDNETYRLKGEWEFHPNAFVHTDTSYAMTYLASNQDWSSVLGSQQGYASYVLKLTHLEPNHIYGLLLEEAGNSHRVYVNDKLILENGLVAKNALIYEPATYTTKAAFVSDEKGEARVIIEIANFDGVKGGLIQSPLFGSLNAIDYVYELTLMTEVFIFAGLLAIAFVFLFLHFIVNDVRSLFMAILSALVALRISTTGTHFIYMAIPYFDLPLIWIIRIEYLSVFLMLPVMLLLLGTFDAFNYPPKLQQFLYVPFLLMPMVIAFATEGILVVIFQIFQIVLIISAIYLIFLIVQAYRMQKIKLTRTIVIMILIFGAIAYNRLYNDRNEIAYFMLYVFILFVGTTVMKRFSLIRSHSEKLASTAKIDHLTGLFNRGHLNQLMEDSDVFELDQKYAVIFLDMNNFKEINDEYGHEIGDQVLRISAKRLRNSCHESDRIFRFGGDEFVIIARLKDEMDVKKVIKRIRDNFMEPIALNHLYLRISVAIGYTPFNPSVDNLKEVISNSDQRMYEDKRKNKFK
ncbi:MAG TPA: hypothetical protein DIC19_01585 [Erysipelotrichaceae bacterium]|nr:hypothetical protein [Erysipelotrichaceae bacterium]